MSTVYLYPPTPVSVSFPAGMATADNQIFAPVDYKVHNFATTNVTDAAYVTLVASAQATRKIQVFMSSGEPLYLAFGAAASEVIKAVILAGGNGVIDFVIPAGTRLSMKCVNASTTVSTGQLIINFLG